MSKSKVEYIGHYGSDAHIVEVARVTTGSEGNEVCGLLRYLMRNNHTSPFEFGMIEFSITAPIFVLRQFMRQRMFKYAEKSMRYTKTDGSDLEFFSFDGDKSGIGTDGVEYNSYYWTFIIGH